MYTTSCASAIIFFPINFLLTANLIPYTVEQNIYLIRYYKTMGALDYPKKCTVS